MMVVNVRLLEPLVALVAGVLILLAPRLLNYVVAIYLLLIGLSGLAVGGYEALYGDATLGSVLLLACGASFLVLGLSFALRRSESL